MTKATSSNRNRGSMIMSSARIPDSSRSSENSNGETQNGIYINLNSPCYSIINRCCTKKKYLSKQFAAQIHQSPRDPLVNHIAWDVSSGESSDRTS